MWPWNALLLEHQSQDIPELMFQEKYFFENPGLSISNPPSTTSNYTYILFLWPMETSDDGQFFSKCRLFTTLSEPSQYIC